VAGVIGVLGIFGVLNEVLNLTDRIRGGSKTEATTVVIETDSASAPADPSIVFTDEFTGDALGPKWQPLTGVWTVGGGTLKGGTADPSGDVQTRPDWPAMTLSRELPADCRVSFRVRLSGNASVAELMLHVSKNQYVRMYLYSIDQAVDIGAGQIVEGEAGSGNVRVGAGGETLAQAPFPVVRDKWFQVVAIAQGQHYSIAVGGQLVVEFDDESDELSSSGTLGLITNGHAMEVDDLEVRKI
jgi:hypothetical protein